MVYFQCPITDPIVLVYLTKAHIDGFNQIIQKTSLDHHILRKYPHSCNISEDSEFRWCTSPMAVHIKQDLCGDKHMQNTIFQCNMNSSSSVDALSSHVYTTLHSLLIRWLLSSQPWRPFLIQNVHKIIAIKKATSHHQI